MEAEREIKYYFLNQDFGEALTGVESASLLRARLFHKYINVSPTMLTSTYNPQLNIRRKKIYDSGKLNKDCKIINLYEFYQETKDYQQPYNKLTNKKIDGWTYESVEGKNDIKVYDQNNNYIMYQSYNDEGMLIFNYIYANNKRIRRDSYDSNGYLSRTRYFDPKTGQITSETYFKTDGTVCIYKHFEYDGKNNNLTSIQLTNRNGEIISSFASDTEFITHWIQEVINESCYNFLIIDKERIYYQAVLNINRPDVFKVCMLHSSHVRENQDILTGSLLGDYRRIVEDLTKQDAVVVFTTKQKEHIEMRFGKQEHIFAIPHSIEEDIERVPYSQRIPYEAICLARYFPEKQHDHLVRIYKKVVEQFPAAKLHFYGFGDEKPKIIKLIKDMNLTQNIIVHGFTDNINEVYDRASLSILTSRREGFSLFVLESLAHGCPTICYDINYGPSDMIDDGVNGYLIEQDNEEKMAERIIEVYNDIEKMRAMSEASYLKAEAFKSKKIAEQWEELIEKLLKDKFMI